MEMIKTYANCLDQPLATLGSFLVVSDVLRLLSRKRGKTTHERRTRPKGYRRGIG
jgi:hypothetical protein